MTQSEFDKPTPLGHPPHSLGHSLAALRSRWGWLLALGLVFVVVGVVALGSVVAATVASVLVVGVMMVMAGVAEIVHAFMVQSWSRFFYWLLLGALYVGAGFLTFVNPLLAAGALTFLLGIMLVFGGLLRLWIAYQIKEGLPWAIVAISGAITLLLGVMILAQWPASSLYVLGIMLGIDLIFAGMGWVSVALALRRRG